MPFYFPPCSWPTRGSKNPHRPNKPKNPFTAPPIWAR